MPARILYVEDDKLTREIGVNILSKSFEVEGVASSEAAIVLASQKKFDIAVLDVNLPGMSGIQLIPHLLRLSPGISIFVTTGESTVEMAVEAMKCGAEDFLSKPFDLNHLLNLINVAAARLEATPASGAGDQSKGSELIATSPAMQKVLAHVAAIAPYNTTVLVTGETGSGKELLVRMVHLQSPRADKPFVALNCAAIPEHLLEDELFGHVKGAFTGAVTARDGRFEQAEGGTLFLDEIGDMSLPLQSKLLRVLQEREFEKLGSSRTVKVDVRIVAATSADLEKRIEEGKFRPDLYYRLNVINIHLPPLRERPEDIPVMAEYFLKRFCLNVGLPQKSIDQTTMDVLKAYKWAGNVRQLQNSMERAAALSGATTNILPKDLPEDILRAVTATEGMAKTPLFQPIDTIPDQGLNFDQIVTELERDLLCKSLEKTGGNKMQAARLLNMKRTTFVEKLKRLGISNDDDDTPAKE